ncbi:hypothetical protein D9611_004477 [Ephemerocybe angulata]|uniref:Uncharacterized protein n=1 Tax=Ephemerocybe angulata TaxID=980116 RepID=A0A8H5BK20_9AGAR|nr:hypothetical protein D9611_004477 [Tulosesus angulatus]
MASSSNPPAPKLGRTPSFFGAIKNIVAAPLTWLSGADQDDQRGKRRREQEVAELDTGAVDDLTPRTKRMRVTSPPKQPQAGYLDPPSTAFPSRSKRRPTAPLARSNASSNLNPSLNGQTNYPRSTQSPRRPERTMSIDPPMTLLRRETPSLNDVIMGIEPAAVRAPSLPLASRPAFRMRSSLTPQPHREMSEPPPATSLASNPTFVRAPSQQPQPRSTLTLGTIAENVRMDRSPSRQRVSSLFSNASYVDPRNRRAESAPVEKALEELDIYKTPLIPTRLRSANPSSSAAAIPDMFKRRRATPLVLMNDDRSRKTSGSNKSPKTNGSKPYAGEGGMKKLLARRKQEEDQPAEDDNGEHRSKDKEDSISMKPDAEAPAKPVATPSTDWFSAASAGVASTSSGSSLRVGRSKTSRNHIARPTMGRSKLKFSAVYEEDGDDAMDGDDEARQRERDMLEEASKKLPAFNIPAGFSFANTEAQPLQNDLTNAKEPPITSLPFSFTKPAQQPETSRPDAAPSRKENADFTGFGGDTLFKPSRSLGEAPPLGAPLGSNEGKSTANGTTPQPTAASSSGIPNFFANSSAASKPLSVPTSSTGMPNFFANSVVSGPLHLPPAPPLTFKTDAAASSSAEQAKETPINDKENPFLDRELKPTSGPEGSAGKIPSFFSLPAAPSSSATSSVNASSFSFQAPPATSSTSTSLPFSFGKPTPKNENDGLPSAGPSGSEAAPKSEPPKSMFAGFGTADKASTPASAPIEAPKPLFGATDASKSSAPAPAAPSPFTFGATQPSTAVEPPKSLFGAPPEPKPLFGSAPAVEAPKPMFGSGTGFSFGNTASEKVDTTKPAASASPAPFTFGATPSATPSTPTAANGTSAASGFNFGPTTPSAPAPFSFGAAASTNGADAQKSPFAFGASTPVNPASRPQTPPKNNDQEFRMEESPTREIQPGGPPKPTLNFSFGNSNATSTLFGGSAPSSATTAPSFGGFGASAPSNPFSSPKTTEESKPFSFTVTPATSAPAAPAAPFSFGPSTSTGSEAPRPSSSGFSFGGAPTPTTAAPPFSFGGAPAAAPNPFASGAPASAPGSPSTFNNPSPFAFNSSTLPAPNAAFSFSQPASPAGSNSGLPSTGFGAQSSGFGQAAPSSPFAPAPLALSTSTGGSLFTIGAAPAQPAVGGAAPRVTRKLPTRRPGAAKR